MTEGWEQDKKKKSKGKRTEINWKWLKKRKLKNGRWKKHGETSERDGREDKSRGEKRRTQDADKEAEKVVLCVERTEEELLTIKREYGELSFQLLANWKTGACEYDKKLLMLTCRARFLMNNSKAEKIKKRNNQTKTQAAGHWHQKQRGRENDTSAAWIQAKVCHYMFELPYNPDKASVNDAGIEKWQTYCMMMNNIVSPQHSIRFNCCWGEACQGVDICLKGNVTAYSAILLQN